MKHLDLKTILKENDITQSQLARALGIRRQQVNDWCRGVWNPNKENTEKIKIWLYLHRYMVFYKKTLDIV